MPTRTVYVRQQDLPLWEKAQTYAAKGRSLSSIVLEGLRLFVEAIEKEQQASAGETARVAEQPAENGGTQTVSFRVGESDSPVTMSVRFYGRLLATSTAQEEATYSLYVTRKGRFLVHRRTGKGSDYQVFDSLGEVVQAKNAAGNSLYPPELIGRAFETLDSDGIVIDLDI